MRLKIVINAETGVDGETPEEAILIDSITEAMYEAMPRVLFDSDELDCMVYTIRCCIDVEVLH